MLVVQTESDQSTDLAKRANISVLSIFARNRDGSVGYGVLVQDGAPVQLPTSIASQQGKLRSEKMTDSSLFGQTSEGISPETQPCVTAIPTPSNQLRCVGPIQESRRVCRACCRTLRRDSEAPQRPWDGRAIRRCCRRARAALACRTPLEVALPAFSAGNIASRPGVHSMLGRSVISSIQEELHSGRPRGCTHDMGKTWVCVAQVRDVHGNSHFFFSSKN